MTTDTAHETWNEAWKTPIGIAGWTTPEKDVMTCALDLRMKGFSRALDLGCGVGRHALLLSSIGFDTCALDASQAGLEQLTQSAQGRGLSVSTAQGRMTDLPFDDESFDYVLSWNVIYHGDRHIVEQTIGEIGRILRPGGVYQGTMLSKRRADYGKGVEISPNTFVQPDGSGDKTHPHFFCNAPELVGLFSGFEIVSLRDVDETYEKPGNWHWHLVAQKLPTG